MSFCLLSACLNGCGGGAVPGAPVPLSVPYSPGSPEPTARPGDWPTYGFDSDRTGYNPNETTLTANAIRESGLQQLWQFTAAGVIDAQPVVAANVAVGSTSEDIAYVGDELGNFYAIAAATGTLVWHKKLLAQVATPCTDLPGDTFGITGAAVIDRATNRVYVADGQGFLHAFDLATGAAVAGRYASGVALLPDQNEHIYGALTFDAQRHLLYAATASHCDDEPFHGAVLSVDTASARVVSTFWVMGSPAAPSGGGIWGAGGVSLDPRNTGFVYALTGNGDSTTAPNAHPLSLLKLSPGTLGLVSAIDPDPTTADLDFGATPVIVPPQAGCANFVAIGKAKSGVLYAFENVDDMTNPALVDRIVVADSELAGDNIGVVAYSPLTGLVYVANGTDSSQSGIRHGLLAFSLQANCTPSARPVWSNVNGVSGGEDTPPGNPSVASGVVYYTNGVGDQALAFDASNGAPLWSTTLSGPSFTAPAVADGRVFVVTWGTGAPNTGQGGPGVVAAYGTPSEADQRDRRGSLRR